MKTPRLVLIAALLFSAVPGIAWPRAGAEESPPTVITDMDTVRHQPGTFGNNKTPVGAVELVEGRSGKACKFTFAAEAKGGFFTARVNATPEWDKAAGLSFWVKGDGSASWGGIEMIDGDDFSARYAYCFPIDSTEWRKITIPWGDLLPEHALAKFVGTKDGGYPPSKFRNLWFGMWWYWRQYPAHSYAIDQIALEREIAVDAADYTPAAVGTPRLLAKLKARRPVTIVTMGDSLSDKQHWANRQLLWSELLAAEIRKTYGSEVRLVNAAMGGTELRQNLVVMPRWLKDAPQPDLVTVWFGYNDWSSGMRGPAFQETLRLAVDRIRRLTRGKSEVLLVTTCPAMERWDTMEELAEAARAVAAEEKTGLADVAAAFHKRGKEAGALRPTLYGDDKTHLGGPGHLLACQTVLKAIANAPEGK
jgi:lysophospholipase L1-like esterase